MKIFIFFIFIFNSSLTYSQRNLTSLQFEVTKNGATEPAYQNQYWDNKEQGIYVDISTGEPLFSSLDKFDSGTGWPSFVKGISERNFATKVDKKMSETRVELISISSGNHLGHIFNDGPEDRGGKRYCVNSAALKFIPLKDMERQGYSQYLYLFKKH